MTNRPYGKHEQQLPSARAIRRTCSNELYRAVKRLRGYVPPDKIAEAETLYYRKVIGHLLWIAEHRSHRKKLCDWWEQEVSAEIAAIWEVEQDDLNRAFREAFGG